MSIKLKAIVFYQYLPPWRIDVFNKMGEYYDLTIAFTNAECEGFTYNRQELLSKLYNIKTIFLNNGFKIGKRPVKFGIYKLLKRTKPDIVFSHEYSPTSILIALYKHLGLLHYKYYLTTSDNVIIAQSVQGLKAKARSYVLTHSNGVIVYSSAVKEWYQRHFPQLKIDICPNIQNPATLLPYRSTFNQYISEYDTKFDLKVCNIVLYVGRLTTVKGLDLLLEAFAAAQIHNYKLVLVGEGNQKDNLFSLAQRLNIQDKVIFAGYYSGNALYAWYDIANFFILPSRYEPFGAVVNEALIYGCPVVASKYIGALDFITPQNGLVFDPMNKNEFINVIKETCLKYKDYHHTIRKNLMPVSFDEYVTAFKNINS